MKSGPKAGQKTEAISVNNMRGCWGDTAPDWIVILADECDQTSQSRTAKKIGYSPAAVSNVLKKRYGVDGFGGDLGAVQQAVEGALMAATIDCPVLSHTPKDECLKWQRKAKKLMSHSPLSIQMYRACPKCPHSRTGGS
jgi:hypothetical protein